MNDAKGTDLEKQLAGCSKVEENSSITCAPSDSASQLRRAFACAGNKIKSIFTGGTKLKGGKSRIWELDFIRGICVLLMVFDHFIFDIADIFGRAWSLASDSAVIESIYEAASDFASSPFHDTAQHIVVWIFCLICGISCYFSRSNLKRGIIVAICAAIVTAVTKAIGTPIRFGILHMFAVAILLFWLIDTICRRNKRLTATVCLVLGIAIICIDAAMSSYSEAVGSLASDSSLYFIGDWMLGGPFYSADYYPIFPSVGYMLIGSFVGFTLYSKRRSLLPRLGKYGWHAPIDIWGRLALYVYILHQVVIAVILALISYLFLTPGDFVII
ncbi:MAG: DUF1624 domain-containing protein [Clostridia bacterium]|nr:DUF1624 domain-containing protein [Clostridia bacterium]